jgi:hypothetical protein
MKQHLFLSCVLAFLMAAGTIKAGPATENGQIEIMQGQRGKYIFFRGVGGAQKTSSSPDMRYIGGGNNSGERGFIYDIVADSLFITPNSAEYIQSPNLYAGGGKIVKNGQIVNLDPVYQGESDSWKDLSIWAATPNVDKIFVMGYKSLWDAPAGKTRTANYMFVYDSDGHVIDTIEPVWAMAEHGDEFINAGYGERVNACNSDGTILVGHSDYPEGNVNFTAAFWDVTNDTSYGLYEDPTNCWGTLQSVNNDGSLIAGAVGSDIWLIRYDRQAKSYTRERIPYSPGMGYSLSAGISETGLVLYVQSTSVADPASRETYLYNIQDGDLVKLEDYCRELYGIEINYPTATGSSISDDGRLITGWTYKDAIYYPYAVILDSVQLYARPRNVTAKQLRGTANVGINWQLPIKSMHTLTGFNVYRDGQKINSSLISASTKFYEDLAVSAGVHGYSVQALYGDSVSGRSDSVSVLVIEISGCLPVQEIESNVIYNRTVQVNWGLPSSLMHRAAPKQKSYRNNSLDVFDVQDMHSYASWSAIVVGDKLIMGEYDRSGLKIYDAETYEHLETVEIEGVDKVYNMTTNGDNLLYIANNTKTITVVNLNSMTRSNVISNRETNVLHVAYSSDLDGGKGGLYYGNAESLVSCNRGGFKRDTIFMNNFDFSISGAAYYDSTLYMFSQTGKKQAQLLEFDIKTEAVTATRELNDNPRIASIDEDGFLPVGLSLCVLSDSTIALGGMLGCSSKTNHFVLLELQASPSIAGYNLYRDSVQLNTELIKGHNYEEDIFSPGTYIYTVEAVNVNGCKAILQDVRTVVTISPIGTCDKPRNVTVNEGIHSAILNWTAPENTNEFVGFNIYRNGDKIADRILDIKYLDFNVDTGQHTYIVEAFYRNSCAAADTVKITIKNEGEMLPPSNIAASYKEANLNTKDVSKKYDVSLKWELPYFETPVALGFSNIPNYGLSLRGTTSMWAAIGWDSEQLDGYEDLYVVGIEYFIGERIVNIEGFVFLNDKLAYMKQAEQVKESDWNAILFDEMFSMDQPIEVAVGYKVTYENEAQSVAVVDWGPKKGYSDLISGDGVTWTNLQTHGGLDNNWCINALVVRKRDISKVKQKNGTIDINNPLVKRMDNTWRPAITRSPLSAGASKTTSPSIRLDGFNIYRNNVKQNSSLQTAMSYTDSSVAGGSYTYSVSAVYNEGAEEASSEPIIINLTGSGTGIENQAEEIFINTYPNPADQVFYVNGDYKSLQILNAEGRVVKRLSRPVKSVNIEGLPSGAYLLRFVMPNSTVITKKLIVR